MIDNKLKAWVVNALRRASYRWPARSEAMKAARISRGLYLCNICKGTFGAKEIAVDHVVSVVGETGFTTFDEYIKRLFCNVSGFQILCRATCHLNKTNQENQLRKEYRNKKKKAKKCGKK